MMRLFAGLGRKVARIVIRAREALRPRGAGPASGDAGGRRGFLALAALIPLGAAAPVLAAGREAAPHAGHGGAVFPWRDPSRRVSPPPPLTGRGSGAVRTPHLPSLGYELDGAVKVFRLTAQPVERLLVDGPPAPGSVIDRWHRAMGAMEGMDIPQKARLWGFNGCVPGPAIEIVQGDRVRIVVANELPEATSVHWHGLEIPNGQDGVGGLTQAPILPGRSFTYEFDVTQSGTFMYHSSFNEKKQVGMGLGGFFIAHPADGSRRADVDIALMLQEWHFLPGNEYVDITSTDPNWFTINGKAAPSTEVLRATVGQSVRLRFANLSNLHAHPIHLHGVTWRVTGTEGGPIPESAQWPGNTVNVPPGAARDVEFRFNHPGYWHMHCHKLHHVVNAHAPVPMGIMPMGGMTMLFDVAPAGGPGHGGHAPPAPAEHGGHGPEARQEPARGQAGTAAVPSPAPGHGGHDGKGGQ